MVFPVRWMGGHVVVFLGREYPLEVLLGFLLGCSWLVALALGWTLVAALIFQWQEGMSVPVGFSLVLPILWGGSWHGHANL